MHFPFNQIIKHGSKSLVNNTSFLVLLSFLCPFESNISYNILKLLTKSFWTVVMSWWGWLVSMAFSSACLFDVSLQLFLPMLFHTPHFGQPVRFSDFSSSHCSLLQKQIINIWPVQALVNANFFRFSKLMDTVRENVLMAQYLSNKNNTRALWDWSGFYWQNKFEHHHMYIQFSLSNFSWIAVINRNRWWCVHVGWETELLWCTVKAALVPWAPGRQLFQATWAHASAMFKRPHTCLYDT